MLNPRCYNEDALHFGFDLILGTAFPWVQVVGFVWFLVMRGIANGL